MTDFGRPFQTLSLKDYALFVHLGCEAQERLRTQEVRVRVEMRFGPAFKAATTDHLSDTVCYAQVCEKIEQHCADKEFKLIERLAKDLYDVLKLLMPQQSLLALSVHKLRPPVTHLEGGSHFSYGDFQI